jgi:hypothetical protein
MALVCVGMWFVMALVCDGVGVCRHSFVKALVCDGVGVCRHVVCVGMWFVMASCSFFFIRVFFRDHKIWSL